jgi:hypothetical protein
MPEQDRKAQPLDRNDYPAAVNAIERMKARGYVPWLSADDLIRIGDRDLLREFQLLAAHMERKGY